MIHNSSEFLMQLHCKSYHVEIKITIGQINSSAEKSCVQGLINEIDNFREGQKSHISQSAKEINRL